MILRDSALGSESDALRYLALAAGRGGTNNAARSSRERLAEFERNLLIREVQKVLVRLGFEGIASDGVLGPQTRNAASAILRQAVPAEPLDLLIELVNHEWIAAQPRFDML